MTKELVLPSGIPWESLHGRDLEECLFWLIDAMGGKNLEWRLGGKGQGAQDQGRDLKAHFYVPRPDGELIRQKWWFEAKGCVKASTVRKSKVQESVLNAAGNSDLDVFVIATNTRFSNPTIDWVKEWQRSKPRLKILLWNHDSLEKLLSNHPEVVIRLFSEALSLQGKLEVIRSRFWNYASYGDSPTLKLLWKERKNLEWDYQALMAVVVSEIANGRIEYRPWVAIMEPEDLANVFINGLLNTLYFINRAEKAGIKQRPYLKGMSYLLLKVLNTFPITYVIKLLKHTWEGSDRKVIPKKHRDYIIRPLIEQLASELSDVCHKDCERVSGGDPFELTEAEVELYWDRLKIPAKDYDEDKEVKTSIMRINRSNPCRLRIEVDQTILCPLSNLIKEKRDIDKTIHVLHHVIRSLQKEEDEKEIIKN